MATGTALFDADIARDLLQKACGTVGLDAAEAELVRLGENGIYRLPGGIIVRVGRSVDNLSEARREVGLATWLCAQGVPTAPPIKVEQPVEVDGHPVTFWEEIPGPLQRGTTVDMAHVLKQLHQLQPPVELDVPPLVPFQRISNRIDAAPIDESIRMTLRSVLNELQGIWPGVVLDDQVLLHGDAHTSNLLRGTDGRLALIDLETSCVGPREWDLTLTATYATSLGWVSAEEYQAFVAVYGYDVTTSQAWPVLRRVRELRMTAWLAQKAAESTERAAEVRHRVACLVDDDLPRHWSRT